MNGNSRDPKDEPTDHDSSDAAEDGQLTLWQMLGSVMSAAFGVQSSKNRKRDFQRGKPLHFIIIGIAFTAVFVLVMVFVVQLVLSSVS